MKELNMDVIDRTMDRLRKNNMEAYFVEKKEDVIPLFRSLVSEGATVTHGGSVTIKECSLTEELNSGKYIYLDRSKCETAEEIQKLYREAYFADVYLTSSNAVTESGLLYNVDGNSNRVSAILFGPKSVIVVCGYNKIVKDLDEATYRVKKKAAPMNTKRLGCETYCKEAGECLAIGGGTYAMYPNFSEPPICATAAVPKAGSAVTM